MVYSRIVSIILVIVSEVYLLENGLARTPPMGWMSWGYYMCSVDCDKFPEKCLNEKLILSVADTFFMEGYQEAGYEYIIIDDCWSEKTRDVYGRLVPDKQRFPNGMKYIADYIHARGLKFGMYTNIAEDTCMHYPGSKNHFYTDAQTFSEWGVDYIKVDGCFVGEDDLNTDYIKFGSFLNMTGRPIVYSCSWPYYVQFVHKKKPDFKSIAHYCNMWRNFKSVAHYSIMWRKYHNIGNWVAIRYVIYHFKTEYDIIHKYHGPGQWNDPDMPDFKSIAHYCNMWRNYHDIGDSWMAIRYVMYHFESEYDFIHKYHGPGHWNDPDMLIFGQNALYPEQSRVHISVYAMWSSPLLLSCDLRKIKDFEKELLLNLDLIAVAQDPLGIMAKPYALADNIVLWVKPHLPMKGDSYPSFSFLLLNLEADEDVSVSFTPSEYGLNSTDGYTVMDVYTGTFLRNITLIDILTPTVKIEDAVMYTLYPL